ncbi:hypothetical protein [uncultured Methylobacterium sp.]|uniref:hypothetical protein n=1 Tax=uncultured Methylobacterium sp. TaxID=157278 RepID=UPI0035CBE43B
MLTASTSKNHFLDTNVLLRHANNASGTENADIQEILKDAVNKKRHIWVSSVLFAELRPSNFQAGVFSSVDELAKYIRSFATVVSPDVNTNLRAARLRDLSWQRPVDVRGKDEKPRFMTLGDALHLSSALWVKEANEISDLEFLTFDDGKSISNEGEGKKKALSILNLEKYTDGISTDQDVIATVLLPRLRPVLSQRALPASHGGSHPQTS